MSIVPEQQTGSEPIIDDQGRQQATEKLAQAEQTRKPIEPYVIGFPGIVVVEA